MSLVTLSMAEAVRITGMKLREITRLVPVDDGMVIETFDGNRLLWDGSTLIPYAHPDLGEQPASAPANADAALRVAQETLATARTEIADLRAERDRLQAENAELTRLLDAATDGDAGGQDGDGEPDLDDLRAQAETLGVRVDKRWGAERLQQEIAKKASD